MTPMERMQLWRELLSPESAALRAVAAECDPTDVASVARLRKRWSGPLVHAALELVDAQCRLARKWPSAALLADREGAEVASSQLAAEHKAGQWPISPATPRWTLDLGCGIGADSRAFVAAGQRVTAVDRCPLQAWLTRQNASGHTIDGDAGDLIAIAADIGGLAIPTEPFAVHLDPQRRRAGRRVWSLSGLEPGPRQLRRWLNAATAGCVKLGPGFDPSLAHELLDRPDTPHSVAYLSEHGKLTQALLWTGTLALPDQPRQAVRLPGEHRLAGKPGPPPLGPSGPWWFTVDPAVERAGLLGELCRELGLHAVHEKLGLLSGSDAVGSPWLQTFQVLEHLPWRPERVRQRLQELDAGVVEVKTRDRMVDPDVEQNRLRGSGAHPLSVFVLRWDRSVRATICRRHPTQPSAV